MNISENSNISSQLKIHIPCAKRFNMTKQLSVINEKSSYDSAFNMVTRLNYFNKQMQDLKQQYNLRPQKSVFTRVSVSQEDLNQKEQNTSNKIQNQLNYQIQKNTLKHLLHILNQQNTLQHKDEKDINRLNTKNILRNICNAQNQFILFHSQAQTVIDKFIPDSIKFKKWINKLRFHTFQQFQEAWSNTSKRKLFTKVYKRLCRKFYIENAIPYIINSRIKNKETKQTHIKFIYRFIEGLQNPKMFYYFKQSDKQGGFILQREGLNKN